MSVVCRRCLALLPTVAVLLCAGATRLAAAEAAPSPLDGLPPVDVPEAQADTPQQMRPYAEVITHTDLRIEMVPIPGGEFLMGSPPTEAGRRNDEGPQHRVRIEPFWMSRCEITWDVYDTWAEGTDALRREFLMLAAEPRDALVDAVTKPTEPYTDMAFGMGKGNQPAICMTDHAARTFCQWLTAKTGRYYRLPTEAEWEYACRAGSTTAYSFGDDPALLDEYAWHEGNSDGRYHEVGKKKPNPWGLYDMHGNVAEWTLDQYDPKVYSTRGDVTVQPLVVPLKEYPRVVRGGGWDDPPELLRSAAREGSSPDWKQQDPQLPQSIWYLTDALGVGFRVVRPFHVPSAEERAAKWDKNEPVQIDKPKDE